MVRDRMAVLTEETASMELGKVYVVKVKDRNRFVLRYIDPKTNQTVKKSTGIPLNKPKGLKEAERLAAVLEESLLKGEYVTPSKLNWEEFIDRYNAEPLSLLAEQTARRANLVLNKVTKTLNPKRPATITADRLSFLVSKWKEEGVSDSTLASYLAQLRASLNWAESIGLIAKAPKFPKIKRAQRPHGSTPHKGRGITKEELERMQQAAYRLFGPIKSKEWKGYLEALWLSGLRLQESYLLSWDEGASVRVVVCGKGRRQVARLLIDAEAQKNNETTLLPLAPEFSSWLLRTPEDERVGRVFTFPGEQSSELQTDAEVGKKVSKLGKMAGVVVAQSNGKASKFASAHDLRRSFGDRWADRVMPVVLRELMRHKSIETTLRYYVGKTAEDVEATCRAAMVASDQTPTTEKYPKSTHGVYAS